MPFRLIPSLFSHLRNIVSSETQCTWVLQIIYRLNLGSDNSVLFVRFFFIVYMVFQWFRFHFQTENEHSCFILSISVFLSRQRLQFTKDCRYCYLIILQTSTERNIWSGLTNRLCSTGAAFIRFWPLSIPDNKMRLNWVRNCLVSSMCFCFYQHQNCVYASCHGLQALIIIGKLFEFLLVQ